MVLPYNNNTPQANQVVAATQAPILQNFQSIDTTLNNVNTGGNFTQVLMQNGAAPLAGGTLPGNPSGIYHMVNGGASSISFNGIPLPWFANSVGDFPLMPDLQNTVNNWGFKIGKMILNFGKSLIAQGSSSVVVTWQIPFTTAGVSVFMTTKTSGSGSSASTKTTSADFTGLTQGTFSCYGGVLGSGNLEFWYLSIGY